MARVPAMTSTVKMVSTPTLPTPATLRSRSSKSTYPLEVVRSALVADTEGVGNERGGCGMLRELRCIAQRTTVTMGADRRRFTPWGLDGGGSAAGSRASVTSADGSVCELPTKFSIELVKGDVLTVQTPGGGG